MSFVHKRVRAPNFTTDEGLLLCAVIERYNDIIENKTTDGPSLQQKQEAWLEVAKEYNASGPDFYRPVESLQNFYKKLKQRAKKHHATGGINEDALLEKVKRLIKGSIEGMQTMFDGDPELMAECSTSNPNDSVMATDTIVDPLASESSQRSNLKWGKRRELKDYETPKSKTRKEKVLGNFSELVERRIDLVQGQQELLSLQLQEEREKYQHNNTLRLMEIANMKVKYEQEEKIREKQLKLLQLDILLKEKQLNSFIE